MPRLNQIQLLSAIANDVARQLKSQGESTNLESRQWNAFVTAANTVCAEFAREPVRATPGMGLAAWLRSDDTGMSSKFMAYKTLGERETYPSSGGRFEPYDHPHDPSDFHRCVKFLAAVPAARDNLKAMEAESDVWKALVANWSELEALLKQEMSAGDAAPKLYQRMKAMGC